MPAVKIVTLPACRLMTESLIFAEWQTSVQTYVWFWAKLHIYDHQLSSLFLVTTPWSIYRSTVPNLSFQTPQRGLFCFCFVSEVFCSFHFVTHLTAESVNRWFKDNYFLYMICFAEELLVWLKHVVPGTIGLSELHHITF